MSIKLRSVFHSGCFLAIVAFLFMPNCGWTKNVARPEMYQTATDKWAPGLLEIRVFAVGKGDAIFLRLPDGRVVMIDTGYAETAPLLIKNLKALGVEKIHLLILTHHDSDHVGGFPYLIEAFKIDKVAQSYDPRETGKILIEPGTKLIDAGGVTLTVLGPTQAYKDENDLSLVTRLEFGRIAVLFAADAIEESISNLLKIKRDLRADVLKVPHHGRFKGFSPRNFFAAIRPEYAIITSDEKAGEKPEGSVTRILKELGARVLLTDELGDIQFLSDGETIDLIPAGK
ncbi:MAG: MBL fold metallo-hydrolase [Candidatus Riflebacteria bacterium]|nr:MBL fold metallo-hydrolase [Candidatus Riflebacteria bacterium]